MWIKLALKQKNIFIVLTQLIPVKQFLNNVMIFKNRTLLITNVNIEFLWMELFSNTGWQAIFLGKFIIIANYYLFQRVNTMCDR